MTTKQSPFEAARETMGLSIRRVAEHLDVDISGLVRIERGMSLPKRETAAALYEFYEGEIPLGMVYDPRHSKYGAWLTREKQRQLKAKAKELTRRYPELAESDRRRAAA